ncbi:FAD-linked oxidoreductase [Rickenella mellea]|uniref:Proline dehydrogenase n=1 Tax=Rickenella mellea TaxID=50990 RepID=A0A4Y7Q4Q0_9AGAM|nr:FAD-linked oxidoreductase [Rickenella mellea]
MLKFSLRGQFVRGGVSKYCRRHISTPLNRSHTRATRLVSVTFAGLLGGSTILYTHKKAQADTPLDDQIIQQQRTPLSSLLRSYAVYTMCSMPVLVDNSPTILATLVSIPGIRLITEAFVRATFYAQFVGGETAQSSVPLLQKLRSENKGALFAYSVEVDEQEAAGKRYVKEGNSQTAPSHKRIVNEMITCIDVSADFEESRGVPPSARRTWVALKMTAMLPNAQSLINYSKYLVQTRPETPFVPFPGCPHTSDLSVLEDHKYPSDISPLTPEDILALKGLHDDLVRICSRAKERGVKIIIDAEYSWYQPAIDAFSLSLMQKFNKLPDASTSQPSWTFVPRIFRRPNTNEYPEVQPLVYATYQAYLKRTPLHLAYSLAHAKANDYALGVKLVRGAYHPHEEAAHISPTSPSAIQHNAHPTDMSSSSLAISPTGESPVWHGKHLTDACYNACASALVKHIRDDVRNTCNNKHVNSTAPRHNPPTVGVLFGTHNWDSCDRILGCLVEEGLAVCERVGPRSQEVIKIREELGDRLAIGQLYGMSDALTNSLINRTASSAPLVIKYVPYGSLSDVMPYLSRRAIENKSVLGSGAAAAERRRAGAEIRTRVLG